MAQALRTMLAFVCAALAWPAQPDVVAAQEVFEARRHADALPREAVVYEDDEWSDSFELSPPGPQVWQGPPECGDSDPWTWQILPEGLIYRSYLAGPKEPRLGAVWFDERHAGWLWDSTLGARVGLLRYGTYGPYKPEGFQLDAEGAAFPRLNMEENRDLDSADFRFGFPLTYGFGRFETKFAYYHISSHLGDEFIDRHPAVERLNYVRDALVWGIALRPTPDVRLYGEVGYAFYTGGGAKPWEFQFGLDYAPIDATGFHGAPFFAINGYLREEVNYGGTLTVQVGWMWRGYYNGPLLRFGFQYLNGKSPQFQFNDQFEEQYGLGLWYDF